MQCRNCGSQQPEGVAFCQECGTPIPPPPPSLLAPTVAAPQPSGQSSPYTNYNPSPSGQAYETPENPYANSPYSPYGQPQPSTVPPVPPNSVPPYAPVPPNNVPTPLSQSNNAPYGTGTPAFASPVPVKPKSNVGLISGIVIAFLVIAIIIGAILVPKLSHPTTTTTTTATATTVGSTAVATHTTTVTGPSGNAIDPKASSIITNIQTASAVDTTTAQPTTVTARFKTYTDFYTTFQFNISGTDVSQQYPAYVVAKYYIQKKRILVDEPLKIDDSQGPNGYGYVRPVQYYLPTAAGAVELYWCRQANCSDEKLAQIASFVVV